MSGPFSNMLRSLLGRKAPPEPDMEHGIPETNASGSDPVPHVDHAGRPQLRADDQLNLFRHLTGIISHPSMTHAHRAAGGRAAPNLGIYSRVVHNEQDAKRGYKRFSWLINSCLGLQIIVAAALTAMGAAGASHSAVTVFGAINTVIAGLLTFLKGSGLPNRLKYYQAEWKRIREFIEQRERDFSRPGCDLDVYAVVDIVEKMYDDVKADLEATVPDRFAGIRGGHKALQGANGVSDTNGEIKPAPGALPRVETLTLSEKLKEVESGFGGKVKDLVSDIAHKSHVAHAAQDAARLLEERSKTISDNATKGLRAQAERVQHLDDTATKELNKQVEQAERLEQHAKTVGDDATRELNAQFERAHQLEQRTMTMGKETTRELGKEVEHAGHLESSFLAKLKELRSEIGNRANLAQEAMHYLQAAYHHDHHDPNEAGKKAGDHQAETGASS